MIIYVETNFVLELALDQGQAASCERILSACEAGRFRLVIPASAIAEATSTLRRRGDERRNLKMRLDREIGEVARSAKYASRLQGFGAITALLIESTATAAGRMSQVRSRLLTTAEVIPLDVDILREAETCQVSYGLRPPDALVLASVFRHLGVLPEGKSCFLNRDSDFDDPKIVEELLRRRCRLIGSFDHGLERILAS